MIGNDRFYLAVLALATAEGDARSRVCLAMSIVDKFSINEFQNKPMLWKRLQALIKETSKRGPHIVNGRYLRDPYQHTAIFRRNSTYKIYAKEIMDIWIETCE